MEFEDVKWKYADSGYSRVLIESAEKFLSRVSITAVSAGGSYSPEVEINIGCGVISCRAVSEGVGFIGLEKISSGDFEVDFHLKSCAVEHPYIAIKGRDSSWALHLHSELTDKT